MGLGHASSGNGSHLGTAVLPAPASSSSSLYLTMSHHPGIDFMNLNFGRKLSYNFSSAILGKKSIKKQRIQS
jgi:hypothetical protein